MARVIAVCHPNRESKRRSEGGLGSVPCLDISARRCFLSGDVSWKAISRRYVCVSYALLASRFATRPRRVVPDRVDRGGFVHICVDRSHGAADRAVIHAGLSLGLVKHREQSIERARLCRAIVSHRRSHRIGQMREIHASIRTGERRPVNDRSTRVRRLYRFVSNCNFSLLRLEDRSTRDPYKFEKRRNDLRIVRFDRTRQDLPNHAAKLSGEKSRHTCTPLLESSSSTKIVICVRRLSSTTRKRSFVSSISPDPVATNERTNPLGSRPFCPRVRRERTSVDAAT